MTALTRRALLAFLLSFGLWTFGLASAGSAAAAIPQSAVYDIQVQGAVNGLPFTRTGAMAIGPTVTGATTNGVNLVDLCLASGSPFISPERGAIWFATNGICINPNGALQDMAFVEANRQAGTMAIRPDPGISATGINGFNGSSGFTAAVWQVFEGRIDLQFQGQGETVTGTLNLLGTGAIFHSENTYVATLSGQARQISLDTSGCDEARSQLDAATGQLRQAKQRLERLGGDAGPRKLARAKQKVKRAKQELREAQQAVAPACAPAREHADADELSMPAIPPG